MSDKSLEPILPNKNETAVISDSPKTAALFYDRVIFYNRILRFKGKTTVFVFDGPMPNEVVLLNAELTNFLGNIEHNFPYELVDEKLLKKYTARKMANEFSKKYKKEMSTLFSNNELQSLSYKEGDKEVISLSMENLQIVDEEEITWEQVLDLRHDKQSKDKYKRFIHWLDKEMIGKSQSFIEDDISIKLEDYEKALKKHGIKTVIGTLKEMLNSKDFLAGTALASGVIGHLSEPSHGLIAGGSLMISNLTIRLAEKLLAFEECETGKNSEISWVYEVKKKTEAEK